MDGLQVSTSGDNKIIILYLQGNSNSGDTVTFTLNMPNPPVKVIASSDMDLEVQINSQKIFNGSPITSGVSFSCDTGCSDCTSNYLNCTACASDFTFVSASNTCAIDPSAKAITWSNSYLGNTGDTTITLTVNKAWSSGSKFEISFTTSKFDFTDLALGSSLPTGAIGATTVTGDYTVVTLTTNVDWTANVEMTIVLSMLNPVLSVIGTTDVNIELKTPTNVAQSTAALVTSSTIFSCRAGCAACVTTFTNCTSCSAGYTQDGSNCIANPTSKNVVFANSYMGIEDVQLTLSFVIPHDFVASNVITIAFSNSSFDTNDANTSLVSSSPSMTKGAVYTEGSNFMLPLTMSANNSASTQIIMLLQTKNPK